MRVELGFQVEQFPASSAFGIPYHILSGESIQAIELFEVELGDGNSLLWG